MAMPMFLIPDWILLLGTSLACAMVAVYWLSRQTASSRQTSLDLGTKVFLFADENLIDASAGAPELPDCAPNTTDWQRLQKLLGDRFPDFPDNFDKIKSQGQMNFAAELEGDTGTIQSEWIDGITRVELLEPSENANQNNIALSPSQELITLRAAVSEAPNPIWRIEDNGTVGWHNQAYARVYQKLRDARPDPSQPLFSLSNEPRKNGQTKRMSIAVPDSDKPYWFDVSAEEHDDYRLFYANDINAEVDAEVAQRNFVQTLAKTFAQLSIGLAIFDRNRQLMLFNPALIDLTSLSADFLSSRPNLFSFFDRLRDSQMMSEPKNYNGWRDQMANLVEAAADGRYQETWSLPSGSVYSVNGRPHPDGAVAFLFEDITAEVTLTRRFRSDIELGHSILDGLNDAIVVFGSNGVLTICNTAYRTMWDVDPDNSFANVTIFDASRDWQEKCDASPVWGDIRDFIVGRENRAEWWTQVRMKTGEMLDCSISPINPGATMVIFSQPNTRPNAKLKQNAFIQTS
jgi:PAS domain-containing protein